MKFNRILHFYQNDRFINQSNSLSSLQEFILEMKKTASKSTKQVLYFQVEMEYKGNR